MKFQVSRNVEDVTDPASVVEFTRQTVCHVHTRCETRLLPSLLPHRLHRVVPNLPAPPRVLGTALHVMSTLIQLLPTRTPPLFRLQGVGWGDETEEVRPHETPLREGQRILPSSEGVKRSHGVRAERESFDVDTDFDEGLVKR